MGNNTKGRNASALVRLGFGEAGKFYTRDGDLVLALKRHRAERGCYAFVIRGTIRYIGVTKNSLAGRMNGYKNPGPSQQTNKRISPKIKKAREVRIFFAPEATVRQFVMTVERGNLRRSTTLDSSTFERFLISVFQPAWNRE